MVVDARTLPVPSNTRRKALAITYLAFTSNHRRGVGRVSDAPTPTNSHRRRLLEQHRQAQRSCSESRRRCDARSRRNQPAQVKHFSQYRKRSRTTRQKHHPTMCWKRLWTSWRRKIQSPLPPPSTPANLLAHLSPHKRHSQSRKRVRRPLQRRSRCRSTNSNHPAQRS
jgi:hypothetical protein